MSTSWATAARQVPGLDHDPCPGDVPGARRLAGSLRERAERLGEAARACRGWEAGGWSGPAAEAARAALDGLGDRLGLLRRSLEDAAGALEGWADELDRLQAEATALGEEALRNRQRRLEATVRETTTAAGTVLGDGPALLALEAQRRQARHRAEELHTRWAAAGRRWSATLDGAAPPRGAVSWRGTWDLAHDSYSSSVRRDARLLGWSSQALGTASAVAAVVALVPPAAPVAAPLSLGLGLAALSAQAHLAAGADGSTGGLVLGTLTLGAGAVAGSVLRSAAAAGSTVPRGRVVAGHAGEKGAVAVDAGQAVHPHLRPEGAVRPRTVADLGGDAVAVTVHDVQEPWQVGHGLGGAGFAAVATVPVPTPPPGGPTVAPPVRTPTPAPHRGAPRRPLGGPGRRDG